MKDLLSAVEIMEKAKYQEEYTDMANERYYPIMGRFAQMFQADKVEAEIIDMFMFEYEEMDDSVHVPIELIPNLEILRMSLEDSEMIKISIYYEAENKNHSQTMTIVVKPSFRNGYTIIEDNSNNSGRVGILIKYNKGLEELNKLIADSIK